METETCRCGCGGKVNTGRFVRGHGKRKPIQFIETHDTNCWLWQLYTDAEGYGKLRVGARTVRAHRAYYEELVGPIPSGLTLDHLCRVPGCVNPGHLEPVTIRENIRRGEGMAVQQAAKTHCVNGHPFDDENTGIRADTGTRYCRACIRERSRRYRASLRPAPV